MSFSIVARFPATGEIGIAAAGRVFAVGALLPHVSHAAALATQGFINPIWGIEGLPRLTAGEAAQTVMDDLLQSDEGAALRQMHMVDTQGRIAQHTGRDSLPWAGHIGVPNVSVAGNTLAGPEVLEAILSTYLGTEGAPFAERLLGAVEAGEAAGGDKRGRQSAAMVIHRGEVYPWLDIRADDCGRPLVELRRLYAVSQERFRLISGAMPSARNRSGVLERQMVLEAVDKAQHERAEAGLKSQSRATSGAEIS